MPPTEERPSPATQADASQTGTTAGQWQAFKPTLRAPSQNSSPSVSRVEDSLTTERSQETRGGVTNGRKTSFTPRAPQKPVEARTNDGLDGIRPGTTSFLTEAARTSAVMRARLLQEPSQSTPQSNGSYERGASPSTSRPTTHKVYSVAETRSSILPHLKTSSSMAQFSGPANTEPKQLPHLQAPSPAVFASSEVLSDQNPASSVVSTPVTTTANVPTASLAMQMTSEKTSNDRSSSSVVLPPAATQPELYGSPNSLGCTVETKPTVFYESTMIAPRTDKAKNEVTVSPGKVYLYRYPGRQVAIWELRWSSGWVVREDIRSFALPFVQGSKLMVRRQDRPDQFLRVTQVRVESLPLAKQFLQTVKDLKNEFGLSTEPRYPYTDEQYNPSERDEIDLTTLLSLGSSPEGGSAQSVNRTTAFDHTTHPPNSGTVVATKEQNGAAILDSVVVDTDCESSYSMSRQEHTSASQEFVPAEDVLGEMIRDLKLQDAANEANIQEEAQATSRPGQQEVLNAQKRAETDFIANDRLGEYESFRRSDEYAVERAQLEARRMAIEKEISTTSPSNLVLIDTTPESPEPQTKSSCANDLEGMTYDQPPAIKTADTARVNSSPDPSIKNESPGLSIKSELDIPSEPAFVLTDGKDCSGQRVATAEGRDDGPLNVTKLSEVPTGIDLSRQSLDVLSNLNVNHYRELVRAYDDTHYWLKQLGWSEPGSVQEHATLQTVVIHLARHTSFKDLSSEDRLKTAAVVFSNLRQLTIRSRIQYAADRILQMRQSARPAPAAVTLANDYMDLALRAASQKRSSRRISAASAAASSTSRATTPNHLDKVCQASPAPSMCLEDPARYDPSREEQPLVSQASFETMQRPKHQETWSSEALYSHEPIHSVHAVHRETTRAAQAPTWADTTEAENTRLLVPVTAESGGPSQYTAVQAGQVAELLRGDDDRTLPPHLRGVGQRNGVGNSRWA